MNKEITDLKPGDTIEVVRTIIAWDSKMRPGTYDFSHKGQGSDFVFIDEFADEYLISNHALKIFVESGKIKL